MDPSPPAWLRSYKAHSSIIPNYASQVRPTENGSTTTKAATQLSPPSVQNVKPTEHDKSEPADANPFAFPSTISLTLHNAGSLDKTYTDSTPNSSPRKANFQSNYHEKPTVERTVPIPPSLPHKRPRGPLCRLLVAIRSLLRAKTQNTLAH